MAGDEELRARALLTEMQLRIAEGPHVALGIGANAATDQIRAAFLQLTKQFHPARFGRMSTDLQKFSNEVFLGIKGAHDQLQKAAGGLARASSPGQSGSIPIPDGKSITPDTVRRTGAVPPVARPSPLGTPADPLARGTQRPSTPNIARPVTPQPARPGTPSHRPSSPAIPRTLTPSEITRPGVQPPTASPTRGTSPIPTQRPTTPLPATPRPATPRPATPPASGVPPKPMDFNPGTIRYSGVQPAPTTTPPVRTTASTPAFDERQMLRESLMLLNDRKWPEARQSLHTLAAKVPQSKNYRALLCYARGREAHAAGKPDEAQLEYQRALQLDPDLDLAKQAIAELTRRR